MKYKKIDAVGTTLARKKIIKQKLFLKNLYEDFYRKIYSELSYNNRRETIVELGSGAGFIKKIIPTAVTSDILKLPSIDMQFSALDMPFKNRSVNAFVMVDVFHHIKDVEKFLTEANRCLKKNGQIVMIEPSSTLFGKLIYTYFHHEPYNARSSWFFESSGPLSGANSALPWIVFVRDRKKFERKYPHLQITKLETHTPTRYLLSGGFTLPQLLPNFMYLFITFLESLLHPLNSAFGMFYTIVIVKK